VSLRGIHVYLFIVILSTLGSGEESVGRRVPQVPIYRVCIYIYIYVWTCIHIHMYVELFVVSYSYVYW